MIMTHIAISTHRRIKRKVIGARILDLFNLARQRRALAQLDDDALNDIGVSRKDARNEAERPFWDAPDSWHKHLY